MFFFCYNNYGDFMSKICVIPSSIKMIENTLEYADAYIIGIENMSINMPVYFSLEDVESINDLLFKNNKELFISLNKNMFNSDLEELENILKKLDTLNIKGILYYDVSLVSLKEKLALKTDLVWNQEHFVTNYSTINYWYDLGIKYSFLSNEITLNEIKNIKNNTKSTLMMLVFGFIPLFTSKRKLVNNYKTYFNIKDKSNYYYIEKENKCYPVFENENGTVTYSNSPINSIKDYNDLDQLLDYSVFNSMLIEEVDFIDILKKYKGKEYFESKYNDTYFLHKESIYKVTKYEKN